MESRTIDAVTANHSMLDGSKITRRDYKRIFISASFPKEQKMKTTMYHPQGGSLYVKLLALVILVFVLAARPAKAAPQVTVVGGVLPIGNTIWTLAGNPYQVDSYIDVPEGATLTIQEGVVVENYSGGGSQNYNFTVEGTLVVNGTELLPVHFLPGLNGWSGINITGQPGAINTGSSLSYAVLDGGGSGGSGVGANLRLQYSQVDVDHCQFINSPGDGILGDDATAGGVANVYTASFTNNAGYAIYFQNGSVNPVLSNLTASGNGTLLPYGGNLVALNDATLLPGEHIWENMGLPYLIWGITVGSDANLIIEPGVQILAEPGNDALVVQGVLFANGTFGQPIRFDPADPAIGWSGIALLGTEELPGAGGVFNDVIITQGGYTGGRCDLYIQFGNATVTNSRLFSSGGSGLCLDHGSTLTMTNTTLAYNQEYAMDVIDAGSIFNLAGLIATGNLSNTIGVEGGTLTNVHTWPKSGINTYDLFYGAVTVAPTGTLNIEAGGTVLFGETRDITIQGTLNAIGTPADPITFTGETPTTGLWAGVNFIGTPEQHAVGHLAYATFEYAGYGGSAMIYLENADVTFTHCILRYCAYDAIEIQPGVALASRSGGGQATPQVEINWSNYINLGGYAVQNYSSQAVNALYNWWGASSGPAAADNPDGTGEALNGPVYYRPYVTGPDGSFIYLPLVGK